MVLLLEVVGTTVVWGVVGLGVLTEPENGQGTNTKRGKEESKTNHLNNKVTPRHFTTVYNSIFFLMLQTQTNRKNRKRLRHSD